MEWKKLAGEYLKFSRSDRWAVVFLSVMILVINFLPDWLGPGNSEFPLKPGSVLARVVDSIKASELPVVSPPEKIRQSPPRPHRLFAFDPNTLDSRGWQELGLGDRTIETISRYRTKGGRFRKPEDLQKVWGLPAGFYARVKDSIRIREEQAPALPPYAPASVPTRERIAREYSIDINGSDSTEWVALPGIGPTLASRIIIFRQKLGGFYSVDQLAEVYGLKDSVFQKIKPWLHGGGPVKTFDINKATKDELKVHPYFRWALANALVNYREQHGNFKSLDELKNITLVTDAMFGKLVRYLRL